MDKEDREEVLGHIYNRIPLSHKKEWNNAICSIGIRMGLKMSGGLEVKASAWNAGDPGSIPGSGRSLGEENGNPLQYSCLENPMEGGAW